MLISPSLLSADLGLTIDALMCQEGLIDYIVIPDETDDEPLPPSRFK